MRNIKLSIQYDGTNYFGWQAQKRTTLPTIQDIIEAALRQILQEDIKLISAGRTDRGVHALAQVANFKTEKRTSLEKLHIAVNSLLPWDIRINSMREVPLDFHSRYRAKSKVYRYHILNSKLRTVFDYRYCAFVPEKLDIKTMKNELKVLKGKHDFSAFQGSARKARCSMRIIKEINLIKKGRFISIMIEADGFLYNMVRIIVGTLIDIGRGKLPKGSVKQILNTRDRKKAGPTAPACGLFLEKVKY
jgi:tRNA pseudouridine38-40 synthase